MVTQNPPDVTFTPASRGDMPFIAGIIAEERMDDEDLLPEQFITVWKPGRMVAFGRIKPYPDCHELGSVVVDPGERGRGLGEAVVRELIRRFPTDEVYITTDLPEYYERLGFLRTTILPQSLHAKIERTTGTLRERVHGLIYDRRIEQLPTLADVYRARHVLEQYLRPTPLVHSPALSREVGFEAHLKLENLQPIGAFKVRGGVNLAASLGDDERERGIIAASTGNHGQSIAYGAALAGVRCVIAMPVEANPMKVDSMRALGAEVEFHGSHFEEARRWAEDHARETGMRYVHHVNTPELVAGVGTISVEILEDLPDVDAIVAPIGGGSGAIGHCIVAKDLRPGVELIGVQAAGAPAVYRSWKERSLQEAPIDTSAEGLATGVAYYVPVKTFIDRLDDMVLVEESEIREAVVRLARTVHIVAEESGAATTAAAAKVADHLRGKKVAIIVSGGNMTTETLGRILDEAQ